MSIMNDQCAMTVYGAAQPVGGWYCLPAWVLCEDALCGSGCGVNSLHFLRIRDEPSHHGTTVMMRCDM